MKLHLKPQFIFPFFILTLIFGIIGGWIRLGWDFNYPTAAGYHGLLMTGGFMGGVITLERTLTMKNKLWLLFPLFCAVSTVFFLLNLSVLGGVLLILASIGLTSYYLLQMTKHTERYWILLLAGALCWVIGNVQYVMTDFVATAVHWWVGFILFTILGERLELTSFLPVSEKARRQLWVLLSMVGFGFILPFHDHGKMLYSISLVLVVLWFLKHDMARHAIRKSGYHRYTAVGMLTAYGWLLAHSVVILLFSDSPNGYDIYIHTFFLGFGFSMIWAHAPIILPVVLRLNIRPFHPFIWIFWGLYQATLLMRITSSLLSSLRDFKMFFGFANGISILLMFASMGIAMIISSRKKKMEYQV